MAFHLITIGARFAAFQEYQLGNRWSTLSASHKYKFRVLFELSRQIRSKSDSFFTARSETAEDVPQARGRRRIYWRN